MGGSAEAATFIAVLGGIGDKRDVVIYRPKEERAVSQKKDKVVEGNWYVVCLYV